ncbi:SDR family oxidoreductase [Mucilaginibacter sp.]|uniref:SDR family oxidoreductase n=1 Tax=Mucilaginibacter sp. TaxID=1882438 RepID=UPI0035BC2089
MTISILGCGWYGLALAKTLVSKNIAVNGSTTSADKLQVLNDAGIKPYLIDLSAVIAPTDFFDVDVLVIAVPPKSRSGEGAEYVPKMQRVIDAVNIGAVKRVVLISSTGVYADLNREVDELTNPQSATQSSIILHDAEELFRHQTGFQTAIVRFGGLIGPGREPGRFFAGKTNIPNGLAPVNVICLDDCIAFTEAVINQDAFGHTFNACTPHHPPKAEFYSLAAKKAGLPSPQFVSKLNEWKIINSVNVNKILGYKFKITNWIEWLTEA